MVSPRQQLFDQIVVTAEVMGHELSPAAAEMMARDLAGYDAVAVKAALDRCRREVRTKLTLADVIARIDDGHPGVEQAWALARTAADEAVTVIWTEEIEAAFGAAREQLQDGDSVGARMTFKEAYAAALQDARSAKRPARWRASLGHDPSRRNEALVQAATAGQLPAPYCESLLSSAAPQYEAHVTRLERLAAGEQPKELAS